MTIKTVKDLMEILQKYDSDTLVLGAWEGIATDIADVYLSRDQILLIDVDGAQDKEDYITHKLEKR